MNGVGNINSVFDEKINDDVSRFVALLGVYPQNINVYQNSFYVQNIILKECWQTEDVRTFLQQPKERVFLFLVLNNGIM